MSKISSKELANISYIYIYIYIYIFISGWISLLGPANRLLVSCSLLHRQKWTSGQFMSYVLLACKVPQLFWFSRLALPLQITKYPNSLRFRFIIDAILWVKKSPTEQVSHPVILSESSTLENPHKTYNLIIECILIELFQLRMWKKIHHYLSSILGNFGNYK